MTSASTVYEAMRFLSTPEGGAGRGRSALRWRVQQRFGGRFAPRHGSPRAGQGRHRFLATLSVEGQSRMRYATTPKWVYVMLIVMGIGFMAGAFAFVAWVPAPTGAIVGGLWLLMGAGFVFFSLRTLARRREDE